MKPFWEEKNTTGNGQQRNALEEVMIGKKLQKNIVGRLKPILYPKAKMDTKHIGNSSVSIYEICGAP